MFGSGRGSALMRSRWAGIGPVTSSINPVSGEGVKANGGIVGLSATGGIKVFSLTGPVNALFDITGYFVPPSAAPVGGVEFAGSIGKVLSFEGPAPDVVLTSVVVTAPTAGFVIVTASTNLAMEDGVAVRCDITKSTSTAASGTLEQYLGGANRSHWFGVRGFPVDAGDTTFNLVCRQENAGVNVTTNRAFITAVFSSNRL